MAKAKAIVINLIVVFSHVIFSRRGSLKAAVILPCFNSAIVDSGQRLEGRAVTAA
jgi:hypothetical protein